MPVRPDEEELTIKVGGRSLGGWEEVHVVRGVERLPSAFYIRTTDKFPGQTAELTPKAGSPCQIYLSKDLILTGYVDVFDVRLSSSAHTVLISGRNKTEDLVDSAINGQDIGGWTFKAQTIGEAARKLAKPFEIEVDVQQDGNIPPPNEWPINPGMTAAQLLEEAARTTGSLIWDDAQGRLVISGVGTSRTNTALVEGQNIETAHAVQRMDIRFSDYYVYGQGYLPNGSFKNQVAHAEDPDLKALGRHRTRIIPWEAPDQGQGEYSKKRVLWEAARRMGRGNLITIGVTGWRDGDGKLWTPNTIVSVKSPSCKVTRDLVISEVTWERGPDRGTTATLTCMPSEGLKPQPLVRQQAAQGITLPAPRQ